MIGRRGEYCTHSSSRNALKRKRTKTYGLVGLNAPLRQGRSLSLPTLPYQKTNRYAVVGAISLKYTLSMMSCFYIEVTYNIKS